jgi:hypothetical protein
MQVAKRSSFGICELCEARVGKAAMGPHLRKCLAATNGGARSRVLLLRAQPAGAPMFWLDIAARPDAKLKDLDGLLRRVWLECCGHLSEFYGSSHDEVSLTRKIDEVLGSTGSRLGYVYDFGSSTELVVSHSGVIEARPVKGVRLVARNEAPSWPCDACDQPATMVCRECADSGGGFCCDTHALEHPCGEDLLLPVVNSPRMGVCGYTGGASRRAAPGGREADGKRRADRWADRRGMPARQDTGAQRAPGNRPVRL